MDLRHGLWAELNNRARGQFGCNRTWFCFCFNFVSSNAQCSCSSIISLRFQVKQIKQVNCKISAKNVNYYRQKTFCHISWTTAHKRV